MDKKSNLNIFPFFFFFPGRLRVREDGAVHRAHHPSRPHQPDRVQRRDLRRHHRVDAGIQRVRLVQADLQDQVSLGNKLREETGRDVF